jgi:HemK-related putative methylase
MAYSPREDSFLLEKYVKKLASGAVLDVGTGSGIQAVAAARKKSVRKVVSVDIDAGAIEHCKRKIVSRKITFLLSDLFSSVHGKFDTIVFNPPYLPEDERDGAANLKKQGFPVTEKTLLMRKEASDKADRRGFISLKYNIIMLVGDTLNDFDSLFYKKATAERSKNVDKMRHDWGDRFIVLPNAMYGDWEGSLYKYDWKQSKEKKRDIRHKSLMSH